VIGVLLMGFGLVAGQLTTSLVLDLVAPVAEHPISWLTVAGTALALVAVSIAAIPRGTRGSSGAVRS
jgi:transporter family-2 protein